MSDKLPSPPEVADLDQESQDLENEREELLFRWRWAVAGMASPPLVGGILAIVGGAIGLEPLLGVGVLIGFYGSIFGSGSCGVYAFNNRNERIRISRELQRLRVLRREVLAGRAKRSAASYARYKEHLPFLAEQYKVRAQRYRQIYVALQLVRNYWFPIGVRCNCSH
jgi:hypothetical protein